MTWGLETFGAMEPLSSFKNLTFRVWGLGFRGVFGCSFGALGGAFLEKATLGSRLLGVVEPGTSLHGRCKT